MKLPQPLAMVLAELQAAGLARLPLAKQERQLRRALRRAPGWVRGHQLLGIVQIEHLSIELAPRSIATLEACARALITLSKEERFLALSRYFLAEASFYRQRFQAARAGFKQLIESHAAELLPNGVRDRVLEQIAACCLVLGEPAEAEGYLLQIPEKNRSKESELALQSIAQQR